MNPSELVEGPMFYGWMDMSAPLKKLREMMSPKGGTPEKDRFREV